MEISGEHRIPAPREQVWEALNDPAVLQGSIPGCEALDKVSDTTFTARIVSKIGSIKARFNGKVDFSDIDAPRCYTISGQGQGGMAGSAKGSARVELEESGPQETVLRYTANAEVAGKLASVGSRLIQGVVRKTADDFFRNFVEQVSGGQSTSATAAEPARPTAGVGRLGWFIAAGVLVAAAVAALMLL
ncbi:CoxG family protein [Halomonas sp. C05BenzN]|uniref:CoxG family protein n=1 Tax=Halomonas sp. C05BenzN TaxID=3411041 RepID=UPI003B960CE3